MLKIHKRGLERENLRIDANGHLSQKSHFEALGVSPNDPTFTLDFAESQLEIVTAPHDSVEALLADLKKLDQEALSRIAPEQLWRNSMPPSFKKEEIHLAHFGDTREDQIKQIYRKGLCYRYGKTMQIICGIHYNLSFESPTDALYFRTIRGFLQNYWLLILLFGASPTCYAPSLKDHIDLSFLKTDDQHLFYGPHATSLRLSELGYHNPEVPGLSICYDSLETFVATLHKATHTPYEPYQHFPVEAQLNTNYLQIENEYYAPIRPKPFPLDEHLPLTERLLKHGVSYLEVRILDLNPLLPLEVDAPTLYFIDLFLRFCATTPELPLNCSEAKKNALGVSKFGLNFEHILMKEGSPIPLGTWAKNLLSQLKTFAEAEGSQGEMASIDLQMEKLEHPEHLPAKKILNFYHQNKGVFYGRCNYGSSA